jgi:hypothetical protein
MSGKTFRVAGKLLLLWGLVKTAWDIVGHIGNVQTLWDMIGAAVQYWPSFLRGTLWIVTSWWFPLIASTICLALWYCLSRREKNFAAVTFDDAIILPSGLNDGSEVIRHSGIATQAPGSRILASCGKAVEKSVVTAGAETWYRARLDLQRGDPIRDIEAIVTDLWEDGKKARLQENLTLTMHPGMVDRYPLDKNLQTLRAGIPEFVDVIRVGGDGIAHFPLKFYPRAVDHQKLLTPSHTYRMSIVLHSSEPRPLICAFEFEWTGDAETSDIRLLSVTQPL